MSLATSRVASGLRRVVPARYRPIGYLNHLTRTRTGNRVRSGPFAGMICADASVGSCYIPKLLGIYERELAPQIELICRWHPDLIVDLGAAEGYYAVGLALRNPHAGVIAFEADEAGRAALAATAHHNHVAARVRVRGRCAPGDLAAVLGGAERVALVCDVEGDEMQLLDPERVPGLVGAVILVETHEFVRRGITGELRRRFEASHEIELIWQQPRARTEFPWRSLATRLLPTSYLDWALSEWRPERMCWLWMVPKRRWQTTGRCAWSSRAPESGSSIAGSNPSSARPSTTSARSTASMPP